MVGVAGAVGADWGVDSSVVEGAVAGGVPAIGVVTMGAGGAAIAATSALFSITSSALWDST